MAKRLKTATKSAKPPTIPQPNGRGALYAGGVPGNKGGTGRPRNAFKKFCRELAASPKFQRALETASTDADSKNFVGAAKLVATFATTKPPKTIKHVHTTSARDRLADRIARLAERN